MKFTAILARVACRMVRGLLLLFRRGGTALPGKVALRICPDVLRLTAAGFKVASVTGTNGKTSSCRMLEAGFREAGFSAFSNRSGANLKSGITTEFILHSTIFGKPKTEWAVIECDEAASARVFSEIQPRIILVTNLFRDQLDRYGEILHTRDCIIEGIGGAPDALVCLNADCPLTSSAAEHIANRVIYFGMEESAAESFDRLPELSDAARCLNCGAKLSYSYVTYAHLGGFYCPACGKGRKTPETAVTRILSRSGEGSSILLRLGDREVTAALGVPAVYNICNAAGAAAVMNAAGLGEKAVTKALSGFSGAFGRFERFKLEGAEATMILVKNPAAFNRALEYLSQTEGSFELVLGLNDHDADGRDVSWIWDTAMEKLCGMENRAERIVIFGSRCADMALRLKYAGVNENKFVLVRGCDCREVLRQMNRSGVPVYILPTYTAMLALRKELVTKRGADFWR